MAAGQEMRVSDAEREAAAAELREHFASGRLTQDEMDERLTAVFAAKTRADLNVVFTDLPSSGHGWSSASIPGSDRTYGSFGPGAQGWNPGASDANSDWQGQGNGWQASAGRGIGRIVTSSVLVLVLLGVGNPRHLPPGTAVRFRASPRGVRGPAAAAVHDLRQAADARRPRRPRRRPPTPPPLAGPVSSWSHPPGDKVPVRDLSWRGPNFRRTGSAMAMRYYAPFSGGDGEPPWPRGGPHALRIGDAERDAAAADLGEHYAAGRLSLDELNERLDAVFSSKTFGQLTRVMADLPGPGRLLWRARPTRTNGGWGPPASPLTRPSTWARGRGTGRARP